MDVTRLSKQLGISDPAVIRKAREFAGLAAVRFPSGMGQGEVCVGAVCLELACQALQHNSKEFTRDKFVRYGCVNAKIYTQTFNTLHQALDVNRKIDLQHLVVQFGCAGIRQTVTRVLNLYKERFVAKLPASGKQNASFSRPVFLASAFYLVAKKNKIKVDIRSLLETLCVPRDDYLDVSASMYQLCFDVVGLEKTKKKATDRKTHTAVLDAHRHADVAPSTPKNTEVEAAGPSGRVELDSAPPVPAASAKQACTKRTRRHKEDDAEAERLRVLMGFVVGGGSAGSDDEAGSSDSGGDENKGQCQRIGAAEVRAGQEGVVKRACTEPAKKLRQTELVLTTRSGQGKHLSCV